MTTQTTHDMKCLTCGKTWNNKETPTPSARCPFEHEHKPKSMYVCSTCESDRVVRDAWTHVNTGEVEAEFDQTYCLECDGECDVKEVTGMSTDEILRHAWRQGGVAACGAGPLTPRTGCTFWTSITCPACRAGVEVKA